LEHTDFLNQSGALSKTIGDRYYAISVLN
jgi:hypothetical protein